jgi:hypothetical protein
LLRVAVLLQIDDDVGRGRSSLEGAEPGAAIGQVLDEIAELRTVEALARDRDWTR